MLTNSEIEEISNKLSSEILEREEYEDICFQLINNIIHLKGVGGIE